MGIPQISQGKKDRFLLNFPRQKNKKSTFKLKKGGIFWVFSLLLTNIRGKILSFKKEFW